MCKLLTLLTQTASCTGDRGRSIAKHIVDQVASVRALFALRCRLRVSYTTVDSFVRFFLRFDSLAPKRFVGWLDFEGYVVGIFILFQVLALLFCRFHMMVRFRSIRCKHFHSLSSFSSFVL